MLPTPTRAYLYSGTMDMRRSIDALSLFVEAMLGRSPFTGEVFVFLNKNLDKVKLLWWDRHGFWLAYKRLEILSLVQSAKLQGKNPFAYLKDVLKPAYHSGCTSGSGRAPKDMRLYRSRSWTLINMTDHHMYIINMMDHY